MGIGAAIGGAVIGAAGSIIGSKEQGGSAEEAADTQAEATIRAQEMQLEYLRETREDIAEAVDAGLIDLETGFNAAISELQPYTGMEEYNVAKGLLSDPGSVMDRPGVQFQYGQGLEAMQAGFSRGSGGGISGPMLASAQQYGQNFASQALDAELNRLFPFINTSSQASSNIANLYQGQGIAKANLRIGGAAQVASATGQAVPSIASTMVQQGNIAATNAINQGNIAANRTSNLTNIASDLFSSLTAPRNTQTTTPAATKPDQYSNMWP